MKLVLRVLTLIGFITMVTVNYLAVALPLNNRSTGAISDSYPNLFAPAGYTFSIWGIIYLLLASYTIYQLVRQNALTGHINNLFIVNAFLNAAWIFAWHYDVIWLSVFIMLGLLVTLILIADILRTSKLSQEERVFIRLPFSVYFGWITVATIANITVFLVSIGWNGFGIPAHIWTVFILFIGVFIGSWRSLHDRNIPYVLVLIWAYGGILSKHLSSTGYNSTYPLVVGTLVGCMIVFTGISIYQLALQKKK